MGKKPKNIPSRVISKPDTKSVRQEAQSANQKPVWQFSTTDKSGAFAWPKGEMEELNIVQRLHEFDSMSWQEIEGGKHHFLISEGLSKQAKDRLLELKLDDEIDSLFSFRFTGKVRMIAIRHANIAQLLWYDPEHKVCLSHKKHT